MGNITTGTARPRGAEEIPARIGVRLGAQRVELYRVVDNRHAVLVGQWAAFGYAGDVGPTRPIPLSWFPWSLGNIRPEEYMFIRNAADLATMPSVGEALVDGRSAATIEDLCMGSVVYIPVLGAPGAPGVAPHVVGAVCAYWSEERPSWPSESRRSVCDLALDALASLR